MKNTKIISMILAVVMLLGSAGVSVFAQDNTLSANAYVTVCDKGALVAVQEKVTVTDIDNDGALTVNDALYAVHEAKFIGGADKGYGSYRGEYGYSISKLWGDESGNFGYTLNNTSCMNLAETVKDGDFVNAYIYKDSDTFSDIYTFFDVNTVGLNYGESVTLTLSGLGYDENWNSVTVPIKDAEITLNGEKTSCKTDENGKVTFNINKSGDILISAVSSSQVLVSPVCIASVNGNGETIETTAKPTTKADCKHAKTALKNKKNATYFSKGYSGDKYCKICGKIIKKGKKTAKLSLKTPKFTAVNKGKKIKIKYTKVKGATGFQVIYKVNGVKKIKTFTTKKSAVKTIGSFKKGTYKIQIRSFVKSKSKKAYSKLSKAKKVVIK